MSDDRLVCAEQGAVVMGSLLERLEQREKAARGRVEALRAEMDRLAERLAAGEALLGRLEGHQADGDRGPGR